MESTVKTLSGNPDSPVLAVEHLSARFGDNVVFTDINFQVNSGEKLVVAGESGCGKSTLLKMMIGLQKPTSGRILFHGDDIQEADEQKLNDYRRSIGVLFQSSALFSSMTIGENIALGLNAFTDVDRTMTDLIVKMKLSMVNLTGYENHYPSELSGGMKKRAGIARAMALDPAVLFFDELSAGLDPVTSAELDGLIQEINGALKTTMIIVSHELASIFTIADRVIMLSKETKGIIAEGRPSDLKENSPDPRVRNFFHRRAPQTQERHHGQ